jgi:hypothetical protein
MLRRIGILGIIGILAFLVWFVGWLFLGMRDGLFHFLFLFAVVLAMVQITLRVAADG